MKIQKVHITNRVSVLKLKSAQKYNIAPEKCHLGHLLLQSLYENPELLCHIDGGTGKSETNLSVAVRSAKLASAMRNFGLKPGDCVMIMARNHLDISIPFYANYYNGHSNCTADPTISHSDLEHILTIVNPKLAFCDLECIDKLKSAISKYNMNVPIVMFDDPSYDLEVFTQQHNGSEVSYRPAEFNHSEIPALLALTSGTTGRPKVVVISYATLIHGLCAWWGPFTANIQLVLSMATLQWLSALLHFSSTPLRKVSRLQCSVPLSPQLLVGMINKYKPDVTAWAPFLLGKFIDGVGDFCDLKCFTYVAISGSSIDTNLVKKFQSKCDGFLYLIYSMSEIFVPAFDFRPETPIGSVGKPFKNYQYKLVDDDGNEITKTHQNGELYMKAESDVFFSGYLNNPEETAKVWSSDGWFKTGDIFYKDETNDYYFVERKRLIIRYRGLWVAPLELEAVIKEHPGVQDAFVVGVPEESVMEMATAAILRRNGDKVDPEEIFSLVRNKFPEHDHKHLHGGLFFIDTVPITPTGKIHRSKLREMAISAQRIMPNKQNYNRMFSLSSFAIRDEEQNNNSNGELMKQ